MGILLKIVYRNLKEHKVKTFIIGIIVTFGMYILIVGNSIIDTVTAGISKNFVEYNTGHIAVFPANLEEPSLLGGPPGMGEDEVKPIIEEIDRVIDTVLAHPTVLSLSPQITGMATMKYAEEGSGFSQLLAVDPAKYQEFFPNSITLLEGRFLTPGEEGIVLSANAVEMLEESSGESITVGNSIILTGMSRVTGMKIREVPVVGIYEVSVASQMMTSFLDSENLRVLNGMTQITDVKAVLTDAELGGLGGVDEDSLFGDSTDVVIVGGTDEKKAGVTEGLFSVFGDSEERDLYNAVDPNSWHYLLIRLEDSANINRVVSQLNEAFAEYELNVQALSWLDAAGQVAQMTTALRLVFTVIILLIAVVAVIIIMNTLVISVTERTGEIGTMRAIGAQKSFVRKMIIMETIIISLAFGGVGILLSGATIGVVGALGLETENLILQMLAGGPIILPIMTFRSVISSILGLVVAGVFASLYPASLALRIEPRQAMASH